jgi:hypothetical protein
MFINTVESEKQEERENVKFIFHNAKMNIK